MTLLSNITDWLKRRMLAGFRREVKTLHEPKPKSAIQEEIATLIDEIFLNRPILAVMPDKAKKKKRRRSHKGWRGNGKEVQR